MPYDSIEAAKKAGFPTTAEGIVISLDQVNKLADIYDAVGKNKDIDNPMAVAWTQWKKIFKKEGNKWVKVESKSIEGLETIDIEGVEIFSARNKPNGHSYSEADLDGMVRGFYETKEKVKPYLKFGHDDKQKLAQNSGMPALGWIEDLKREGKKLIADFVKVPKKVYDLILSGAYKRVSAEIFWDIPVDGKKYKRLLKAVALLGAETPACMDLDDIIGLYVENMYKTEFEHKDYEFNIEDYKINDGEVKNDMEKEQLEKKVKELEEQLDALKKQGEDSKQAYSKLETEKAEMEKKLAEIEKEKEEAKKAEIKTSINAIADRLIQEKHLLPADKDAFVEVVFNSESAQEVRKYKLGEKEESLKDILVGIIEKYEVKMNTEDHSEIGSGADSKDNKDLREKAEKYAKDNNVSYKEALRMVAK